MTFTGSAADVEDGDLSLSLAWSSDVDGPLGTGARRGIGAAGDAGVLMMCS